MAVVQQGVNQQTPAAQSVWRTAGGSRGSSNGGRRKRKKKATRSKRTASTRRASSSKKRPARLVKGSLAAKRYMASIRRKRK